MVDPQQCFVRVALHFHTLFVIIYVILHMSQANCRKFRLGNRMKLQQSCRLLTGSLSHGLTCYTCSTC